MAINYKMNSITCHEFLYRFAKLGCSFVLLKYRAGRAKVGGLKAPAPELFTYTHRSTLKRESDNLLVGGGPGLKCGMSLLGKSNKKV